MLAAIDADQRGASDPRVLPAAELFRAAIFETHEVAVLPTVLGVAIGVLREEPRLKFEAEGGRHGLRDRALDVGASAATGEGRCCATVQVERFARCATVAAGEIAEVRGGARAR